MGKHETINTTPHAQELWEGIAGHFDSLTQVLAEFIDNSVSNFIGKRCASRNVFITVEDIADGESFRVTVEDTGTGIEDLSVALRLGDRSKQDSPLSEHGFGVKHALATADPQNRAWVIATRSLGEFTDGQYRRLTAPYSFEMDVEHRDRRDDPWPGIHNGSGTVVQFECTDDLFNTITQGVPGRPGFARTLEYLSEDLGFIYSDLIRAGSLNMTLNDGHSNTAIRAIEPDWVDYYPPGQGKLTKNFGGGEVELRYEFGEMRSSDAIRHYKRNMSTSGAEVRLNGRLIENNVFKDIWNVEPHPQYNHFLARINLVSDEKGALPKTRSSKNGFRDGDEILAELYEWIRTQITPPKQLTNDVGETDLVREYADNLRTHWRAPDKVITPEFKVYKAHDNPPRADLYAYDGRDHLLHEAKKHKASVQDLYQLIMYWDGAVEDGIEPDHGYLIASEFSPGIDGLIDYFNGREDANGNPYSISKRTWREIGVNFPPPA